MYSTFFIHLALLIYSIFSPEYLILIPIILVLALITFMFPELLVLHHIHFIIRVLLIGILCPIPSSPFLTRIPSSPRLRSTFPQLPWIKSWLNLFSLFSNGFLLSCGLLFTLLQAPFHFGTPLEISWHNLANFMGHPGFTIWLSNWVNLFLFV